MAVLGIGAGALIKKCALADEAKMMLRIVKMLLHILPALIYRAKVLLTFDCCSYGALWSGFIETVCRNGPFLGPPSQ